MFSGCIDFDALPEDVAEILGKRSFLTGPDSQDHWSLSVPGLEIVSTLQSAQCSKDDSIIVLAEGVPRFIEPDVQNVGLRNGVAAAWVDLYLKRNQCAVAGAKGA